MNNFYNQLRKAHGVFTAIKKGARTAEAIKEVADVSTREVFEWAILLKLPIPSYSEKSLQLPVIATHSVVELFSETN